MRKSEIVFAIIAVRTDTPPPANQILKSLSSALKCHSLLLDNWDGDVAPELAQVIIRHVSSVRGELTMQGVIGDIDIILKRMTCDSLAARAVAASSN
jgi:hypothetical protein